jgi:hypothetical protein
MMGYEKIIHHNKTIIALKENALFLVVNDPSISDILTVKPINITITENNIKDLYLTEDFLYIYDGKKLHTFSFKLTKK